MAERAFELVYYGPALEDGRMQVRDLAPSLLAMAELVQEAHAIASPAAPPVSLTIEGNRRSSFAVQLAMVSPDITGVVAPDPVGALTLLFVTLFGSRGLLDLIKWLRRRHVVREERLANGRVRLTLDDGETIELDGPVANAFKSVRIRRSTRTVVSPLLQPGIDRIEIREANEVSVAINSDEADAFGDPDEAAGMPEPQENEVDLQIVAIAFPRGQKWRFSDGATTFYAGIEDAAFLDRVHARQEAFRDGDLLRARIRLEQRYTAEGTLTADITVVEVLSHRSIPPITQPPLTP